MHPVVEIEVWCSHRTRHATHDEKVNCTNELKDVDSHALQENTIAHKHMSKRASTAQKSKKNSVRELREDASIWLLYG